MLLQEMLQKLLHLPPLLVLILGLSAVFLLPQKYKQRILALIESVLTFDLMTVMEALPSPGQTWGMLLYCKAQVLDPLARILLGWEAEDDNYYEGGDNFTGSGGALFALSEHCNATGAHVPDRTKITSRAQLHQLRNGIATQGISVALGEAKTPAAPSRHYVHGLVNTGNSCFLNSVLQALSSVSILPPYLEAIMNRSDELELDEDDVQVTEALLDTMKALQQPLASHKAFRPRAIVSALEASRAKNSKSSGYNSNIMNREQQDAQELFQIISSALSSEQATVQKLQATRPLLSIDFLKKLVGLGRTSDTLHQVKKTNSNPMMGMLASRLSCMQCGYTEAVRHFTFDNLSLSLPSNHSCSIEDCLKHFINLESLDDAVCRKCSLLATVKRIGEEIKQLDGRSADANSMARRRVEEEDIDSWLSDDNNDSYPGSGASSVLSDSDDETITLTRTRTKALYNLTEEELAEQQSKLLQQRTLLEAAIRSDVQRPLPGIKLTKVFSPHSTKQVMIAKPPSVLCLHFVRSQYSMYGTVSKNSCHVNFPEYLDISRFCTTGVLLTQPNLPMSISEQDLERMGHDLSKPTTKSSSTKQGQTSQPSQKHTKVLYKLQSIVVHYGGHSYGHFIAYRRKPESMLSKVGAVGLGLDPTRSSRAGSLYGGSGAEDWFRVSDETVESVTLGHVLRSNPYMCLYEKVETPEENAVKSCGTVSSSLSLQAVEMGLRKLLQRKLKISTSGKETEFDQEQERLKQSSAGSPLDSSRVDLTAITEKEYADLFKEQPKAISALLRMGPAEHDEEDMSDMDSIQSHDEDRAWRSFVSSPNSTTPPSPSTGSSNSSASSSSFTSPILKQRSNRSGGSKSLSLNSLRIQSGSIPDLDLVLDSRLDSPSPSSPVSIPDTSFSTGTTTRTATTTKSASYLVGPCSSEIRATSTAISPSYSRSKSSGRRKK